MSYKPNRFSALCEIVRKLNFLQRATPKRARLLLALLLTVSCWQATFAQTGPVDPGRETGAPKGSYTQNEFESINLYNGHADLKLPLMTVLGRGGAKYNVIAPLQSHRWDVMSTPIFNPNGTITYNNVAFGTHSDLSHADPYGPGLLEVVTGLDGGSGCVWTTLARVVLSTPTGAEIELRDDLTDGRPEQQNACPGPVAPVNRGRYFHSADGSAIKFISDADIVDHVEFPLGGTFPEGKRDLATGTMITRDGTRYRYEQGILKKITDRNGNSLVFEYEAAFRRLSRITDTLGRVVNFTYGNRLASDYFDDITYSGIGGAATTIRVRYKPLSQTLRPDQTLKTIPQLFPNINQTGPPSNPSDPFDPKLVSSVEFPGNRQYQVAYNSYAEVAKLTLPQGGAIEYDYGGRPLINTFFYNVPDDTGVLWHVFSGTTEIQRRVKERRTYSSVSQLEGTTKYKDIGMLRPVPVEHLDALGNIIFSEKHHFFTSEIWADRRLGAVTYAGWQANREFRTELLNSTGQVVHTVEYNWEQRAPVSWYTPGAFLSEEPANDPRVADMTTTLNDTGQVTKTTFLYDQFNNPTEEQVFDYGQGTPGGLLRKTETEYLTINPVNSLDYTSNDIHILNLVKSVRVYGPASATAQSRTDSEYDNYNDDTNNKPLLPRPSIIRLDPVTWIARGNLTKTEFALNVDTGQGPKKFSRYDVAGNVVSTKDPRGNVTEFEYDDAFSDSIPRNTFAYVTLTRSPIPDPQGLTGQNSPLVTAMVYDFHTGYGIRATDANNQITTTDYHDVYGRPSRITRPSAGGETNFEYSDTPGNIFVKTLIKQDATRSIESRSYLDGLGKTVRSFLRTGESPNPWIATDTLYDDLGRVSAALEPYAVSTPGPTPGTCGQCSVTSYDELGRVKTVVTPDGSTLTHNYAGNIITTTDPAGRTKRVIHDALGRATQIVEDPNGVAHSTTFVYDALSNVRKVVQDQQQRFYSYDALSRVIRIRNVEDNVNTQLPALTDPITSNSQWSKSFAYDDNGNVIQAIDARNVVTTNTYDRLNRHTGTSYSGDPSGTLPVTKTYDFAIKGRARLFQTKTTGTGGSLVTLEEYDNYGNVLTLKRQFDVGGSWSQPYTTTYTYNFTRGVTSVVYPSGRTVSYHYDDAARADSVTGNLGDGTNRNYSTGISYMPFGRIKQEVFGTTAAIYNKRFYNSRRQLAEILASTSGNDTTYDRGKILNQFSLQCSGAGCNATDNNGNVRKQEVFVPANEQASSFTSWHQQYDYDSLNRLKRVTETTGNPSLNWQQEYDYDRWGNRTINQSNTWGPNIPEPAFGVNAANNRLTAPAGFNLSYDNAGNILADTFSGVIDRVYDGRQKMTEARSPGGQLQKYVYDGDGQRVRRNVNGIETWQIYGLGGELLAEYPANGVAGSPQKEYAYRNGEMLVTTENVSPNAPAPSALAATPPTSGTNVVLNWTAASGAVNYRIERKAPGLSYTSVGTTAATTFTDTTAVSGTAYLYKVCAANGSGNCTSPYSNVVLGSSITFTDPTIIGIADDPSGVTVTAMKAVHITQLRTAVNAVRSLAGLPNATWTFSVAVGQFIHVEDVREMRTALDAALAVLQVQVPTYTDPAIKGIIADPANATVIKAAHIRELRLATTNGIGGSGGPASGSVFSINWLVTDQLGTPRMAFSLSGTVSTTRRFDYLPFGEELNASHGLRGTTLGYTPNAADNIRQKFTSQERDFETGLDYFGARYFSSSMGRFTGPDTVAGSFDHPQTLNLYAYVNNNPLRATDPTGNWTFDVMAAFLEQDPNKPTTGPQILITPTPGPGVTITITEVELVEGEADRIAALNSANKWAFNRLMGKDILGLLQFPRPSPMPAPTPAPQTGPSGSERFWKWFDRYRPHFGGITGGGQLGLSFVGNGGAGSFSYTKGVFGDTLTQGDFWSSGGFMNPTKYSASIPAFASIGAGVGLTMSNAKDASEFVGTSQQVSLATLGAWGGDVSWSRNSSGELIWTLNVTVGKSFGAGIVTYPSKTTEWCLFLCK